MFVLATSSVPPETDRKRLRRAVEKKRLDSVKKIHEQLKMISKTEMDYIQNLRERFEPKITYPDDKDDDDI